MGLARWACPIVARLHPRNAIIAEENGECVGYLVGNDRYFKRDDVGIIYQINIAEGKRRALVGATLLKSQFDRSAYGCKLYCCWCAQDIEANRFWESMGFVPLAFRSGSRKKDRVHIFWQKRIRAGDVTTPYWFPSQTGGGSIREDRIVLPIPPGVRWSDEMPRVLPEDEQTPTLEGPRPKKALIPSFQPSTETKPKHPKLQGFQFGTAKPPARAKDKPRREKKKAVKNDPKMVAAARELRDRWLEHANAHPEALEGAMRGKYDISRVLPDLRESPSIGHTIPVLPAPIAA